MESELKPDKAQIRKWIKALRSGKYNQTTGSLQDDSGYCCLGVACVTLIPKKNLKLESFKGDNMLQGTNSKDQPNAPEWLKNIQEKWRLKFGDEYSPMGLNDTAKYTFDEIADCLELEYVYGEFGEQN